MLKGKGAAALPHLGERLAALYGGTHAVPCASGLSALQAALVACNIRRGGLVACDPILPFSALAATAVGARVCFYELRADLWSVEPASVPADAEAVVLTSWLGVDPSAELLADIRCGTIILDRAQCYGPTDDGVRRRITAATLSFQEGKPVSCGQGGAVITDSGALALAAHRHVSLGWYPRNRPNGTMDWESGWQDRSAGISARLADPLAALLLRRLWVAARTVPRHVRRLNCLGEQLAVLGVKVQPAPTSAARWKLGVRLPGAACPARLLARLRNAGVDCYRHEHPVIPDWPVFRVEEGTGPASLPNAAKALRSMVVLDPQDDKEAERALSIFRDAIIDTVR